MDVPEGLCSLRCLLLWWHQHHDRHPRFMSSPYAIGPVRLHGFDFFKEIDGKIHYMEDTHKANHHAAEEVPLFPAPCGSFSFLPPHCSLWLPVASGRNARDAMPGGRVGTTCGVAARSRSTSLNNFTDLQPFSPYRAQERICMELMRSGQLRFVA